MYRLRCVRGGLPGGRLCSSVVHDFNKCLVNDILSFARRLFFYFEGDDTMEHKQLAQKAIAAKKLAYAPYSGFQVGAALLAADGTVYTGCNVESAAFSPTCCAERTALVKAVSEGLREFTAIAISGGTGTEYCYPCGVCRQLLYEFGSDDLQVIVVKTGDDYKVHLLGELLPYGFGAEDLV